MPITHTPGHRGVRFPGVSGQKGREMSESPETAVPETAVPETAVPETAVPEDES